MPVKASKPAPECFASGDYDRKRDKRLNQIIAQPPKRYRGMVPVIIPETLAVSLAVEDENCEVVAVVELTLPVEKFEEIFGRLNGQHCRLFIRSARCETNRMEYEHTHPPDNSVQLDTKLIVEENLRD